MALGEQKRLGRTWEVSQLVSVADCPSAALNLPLPGTCQGSWAIAGVKEKALLLLKGYLKTRKIVHRCKKSMVAEERARYTCTTER